MRIKTAVLAVILSLASLSFAQGKHVWVLRSSGEMIEYDPSTFAVVQTVKVPAAAAASPQSVAVNHAGQILYVPSMTLPLAESDVVSPRKAWIWNGHEGTSIDLGVKRETAVTGSNQALTESAPTIFLSADGSRLFWFANQGRRLQREDVDLSTTTTWQAWSTDLTGAARQDIAVTKFPECRCSTGSCEETCPAGVVWAPEGGVGDLFVMTQVVTGQTDTEYKTTTRYVLRAGRWTGTTAAEPLQRPLDAGSGDVLVEAIPDKGCCGASNASDDQTLVLKGGKKITVFDERATYKNQDYDVSFLTSNAKLSPDSSSVAMTIVATEEANQPIQLAEEGQANPEESKAIRQALGELPAVELKSIEDSPKRLAFVPHATLVGWISDKEILIVEDHLLVGYNVATGARRKSTVKVENPGRVFVR